MDRFRIVIAACLFLLLVSGCSRLGRVVGYMDEEDLEPNEVPPGMMSRQEQANDLARVTLEGGSAPPQGGSSARLGGGAPAGVFTPDEDIVWTNPDDPDAPLPGLEETLAIKKSDGAWLESYQDARKVAMREGKPLLMWFTDTMRSPLCPFLSAELLSQAEFGHWAAEHVVRLRLDFNVKGDSQDEIIRKRDYLEKLKKRYKVRSLPSVLVMAPDGTVTGRYRGYKRGEPEFYWGRLKNSTRTAENHHKEWKTKMVKKGYRDWKDRKGRPLFAKLLQYRVGDLLLVEPSGRKIQAEEKNLSEGDRLWIANEKAKRGR